YLPRADETSVIRLIALPVGGKSNPRVRTRVGTRVGTRVEPPAPRNGLPGGRLREALRALFLQAFSHADALFDFVSKRSVETNNCDVRRTTLQIDLCAAHCAKTSFGRADESRSNALPLM